MYSGEPSTPMEANDNNTTTTTTATTTTTIEVVQPQTPPTTTDQRRKVYELMQSERMREKEDWFLLATKWWSTWKEYVGYDARYYYHGSRDPINPGPIDNSSLLSDKQELLPDVAEHRYGGGPVITRKVVSRGRHASSLSVEVRPLTMHIIYSNEPTESHKIELSKASTVGTLKDVVCKLKNINPDDVRLWDYHDSKKLKVLVDSAERLDDAQILHLQNVLVEFKKPDGTWPEDERKNDYYYNSNSYYNYGYGSSNRRPTRPGLTGLNNLGNTCFMNSSLQCLSNTTPLSDFFIGNTYLRDVNADNPLGMRGKLAEEFAKLVRELWSGQNSAVAPREFKYKLEGFAPQFSGYQQHDSQELLAFLLDGLHEDLNRVKKKPYAEMKESDGRPDDDVAREAWALHKSRNDSIVVDWFQGQLKSTLVCPECSRVSITFDPFMYLSLPLPMKMTRTLIVTFFSEDGSKLPIKYGVKVPKFGTIADLKVALCDLCGVSVDGLVVTEVYNFRFFKKFNDNDSIDSIQDRDTIYAYQIYVPSRDESAWDVIYCPVYNLREGGGYLSYLRKALFGVPFIISIPPKVNYSTLYTIILRHVQRYLKVPIAKPNISVQPETQGDDLMVDVEESVDPQQAQNDNDSSGYSSDSEGDEMDSDNDDANLVRHKTKKTPQGAVPTHTFPDSSSEISGRFFTIMSIDNYGQGEKPIEDDGGILDLEDRQHLAIFWNPALFSKVYDPELEREVIAHSSAAETDTESNDDVTLDKCLELFTATERLGPDDPWYCNKCKEFRQATKKFDLWKIPPVLVIHLKRFSYRNKYWREKLETHVDFPIRGLNLSHHLLSAPDQPPIYDLYAVSNHYGSMGGGHYTAYALNKAINKWYKFDDSYVSEIEESHVVTNSGYVLFYRRRETSDNNNNNNNMDTNINNNNSNSNNNTSLNNGISNGSSGSNHHSGSTSTTSYEFSVANNNGDEDTEEESEELRLDDTPVAGLTSYHPGL